MKKLVVLLLALILCVGLVACAPAPTTEDTNEVSDSATVPSENDYVFSYNSVDVPILAKAESIIASLGEPTSKFEAPSCAFGELDTTYTYPSVEIGTYQEDGVEYISYVLLKDDAVETPEGLYIGTSLDAVKTALGEPTEEGDTTYTYMGDNMRLLIFFEGNEVTSIEYMNNLT